MKNTKKGFTLVELLVVIAIVAILATVAIIGYTSFLKKADLSNDQSAIAQMNTALQASAIPNGFENPSDAIDALYNLGWNVGKLETYSSGFHYVYNYTDNKMYLMNDKDEVIYPESTDKSQLWGFYDSNSSGLLDGVTKYIAMSNITNLNNFATETQYQIDLNRHYVDVEGTYANITLKNGGVVNGSFTVPEGETIITYTKYVPVDDYNISGTFENYVFDNFVDISHNRFANAKFINCIFYDSSIRTIGDVEFVNCEFVSNGGTNNAIDIYDESSSTPSYSVKITNCKFTGGYRAINTSGQPDNTSTKIEIIIDGCEFNAVVAEKGILQVGRINQTVTIKNTVFNGLGQSKGIISLHGTILNFEGVSAECIKNMFAFSGNTINEDILVEQYVFWRSEPPTGYADVDETITNLMK